MPFKITNTLLFRCAVNFRNTNVDKRKVYDVSSFRLNNSLLRLIKK